MQAHVLGLTLLAVLALVLILGFVLCRLDGLALFAPKSTKRIAGPADAYCGGRCRTTQGLCPLTDTTERGVNCPLWRFVDADLPTALYGSPFKPLRAS